jgi:hypothetical protein
MDLVNLLSKLQAISEADDKADKDYDGDGKIESGKDEYMGSKMKAAAKSKANEDIENVLRGLLAIQEGEDNCSECGEVHEGECAAEKIDECGMDMSPLTSMADANGMPAGTIDVQQPTSPAINVATDYDDATDSYPGQENGPAEEKPKFTLSIQNGDSNLSMTTDVPDEIIHVMKLAGVQGKVEVKKAEPKQDGAQEKEVEEAWGNTPAATNEKEPRAYGDIRDWGLKGTGKGKPGYGDRRAPGQGDNPMSESAMFAEYKQFKAGK